nr:TauD/TfdA family dioxygenase [Ramlibacter aurantiacus]
MHPLFAAEVRGIDLRERVPEPVFDEVNAAFGRYAVLLFPGQDVTDEQQVAFSQRFGPLEPLESYGRKDRSRLQGHISDMSNLDADGKLWDPNSLKRLFNLGNRLWHTDSSFKHVPALCSLLSARSDPPPEGGGTEFTDLRAAYDALPPGMKARIDGLVVEHSIARSRELVGYTEIDPELNKRLPPVRQRLVRVHPGSGRKTLYLASHASHVVGWPLGEGRALLAELMEFATQPRFVWGHSWTLHDLVMWDNRCTMHRALPYDDLTYQRVLHRTTVSEHANTLEQLERAEEGA